MKGRRDQDVPWPVAFAGSGRGRCRASNPTPSFMGGGAHFHCTSRLPQLSSARPGNTGLSSDREGFREGRSFCQHGFDWPPWGRSDVDTVQPSRPTLQPTPLLHLQPAASSSPVSPDSGPIETSVSRQSRLQPAGTFCTPGEGQGRALRFPWRGTDSLKFHFPPSSSLAGSGNVCRSNPRGSSHRREPSSTTGPPYPKANPEPNPGRPPTASEVAGQPQRFR